MNHEQKLLAKRLLQENKSVNEIAKTFNEKCKLNKGVNDGT